MNNIALITGASGGIGAALARKHAAFGGDLILAARSKDKLDELAAELKSAHGTAIRTIGIDLAQPESAQALVDEIESAGHLPSVDILMNNAGIGGHGKFHERDWEADRSMMQLNIVTLTSLTRFLLPGMVERRKGRILNLASTAAFMPGPLQAVYFASKAYVLSFTEAIAEELQGTGVTATALCPGYTETGFKDAANLGGTALANGMSETPEQVAETGYHAMLAGEASVVSGTANKFLAHGLTRLMPRGMTAKIARKLQQKS